MRHPTPMHPEYPCAHGTEASRADDKVAGSRG